MSRPVTNDTGANHPDRWGDGLRFAGKSLSIKSVSRAATPADVLPVCLAHNLRQHNGDHRHRSRIDPARSASNEVMRGPVCPAAAAKLAADVLDELGIKPARRDAIMGVEMVFQPPPGADLPAFWLACMAWADSRYPHVVSAVIHRDQRHVHMHVLALAVTDGRLAGDAMTGGAHRFTAQRRDFLAHIRDVLGLRPDRRVKSLADLAISSGKGAKTHAAAARRDAALVRSAGDDWRRRDVGMGVDGHGGSSSADGNPHAQAKTATPLLRSLSPLDTVRHLMRQIAGKQRQQSAPIALCPQPIGQPAAMQPESVSALSAEPRRLCDDRPELELIRERDSDRSAGQWCAELGEFVSVPTRPNAGRAKADAWVTQALGDRIKAPQSARSA